MSERGSEIHGHESARNLVRSVLDAWMPSARVTHEPAYGTSGCVHVQLANGSDVRDVMVTYALPTTETKIRRDLAALLDGVIPLPLR